MTLGMAFFLAFIGPPLGLVLGVIGGLIVWRGAERWQRWAWGLVFVGAGLAMAGLYMYWAIGQVNWGL